MFEQKFEQKFECFIFLNCSLKLTDNEIHLNSSPVKNVYLHHVMKATTNCRQKLHAFLNL